MSNWKAVCQLADIPAQGARVLKREGKVDIAIFRTLDDQLFALHDKCPHKGGPLSQGLVHGKRVSCPLHGWNFELDSGQAVAPDSGSSETFAVKVDNGSVWLVLD